VNLVLRFRWPHADHRWVRAAGDDFFPSRDSAANSLPPLNEGTILYMPTAVPGMAIGEADKNPANPGSDAGEGAGG
jgi:Cu(I)/Ag(I) efflux system membrane protein CusA/SilA